MSSSSSICDVFEKGGFPTVLLSIEANDNNNNKNGKMMKTTMIPPPKPLLIAAPSPSPPQGLGLGVGGDDHQFPVLLLLHGYLLYNHFYSQLLQHIASHGFIVIAPQLYTIAGPDSSEEIKATAAIIDWLTKGLKDVLPPNVQPNIDKLALSGHSRGGKAAFALALKKASTTTSPLKISALIGIDPVDGMDKGKQTPPQVLTYSPRSFDCEGMPILVIGSGLGAMKKNLLFPPCAPKGVNHEDFYDECKSLAWYFLVKDYGHFDMLDDETKGIRGKSTYCLSKNGKSREPMRRFVGGVIVAFLNTYLRGDETKLVSIRDGCDGVPVEFDKVEFRV